MVVQVDAYQLFGIVQRVHFIVLAIGERMNYANKMGIHAGAVMSLKPKDLPYLLLFRKSKLSNIDKQQIYKSYFSTSCVINSLLLLKKL